MNPLNLSIGRIPNSKQAFLLLAAALLWLSLPTLAPAAERAPLRPDPYYSQIARRLADFLPREHLSHLDFDNTISSRAWTNYIASLDYNRIYFLQEDINSFRSEESKIDDQVKDGDVGFAFRVFETFLERVRDRHAFTTNLLARGIDLHVDETFRWKRDQAPWPADRKEWDELWRKRIKNDYVRRMVARELARDNASSTNRPSPQASSEAPPRKDGNAAAQKTGETTGDEVSDDANDFSVSPKDFIIKSHRQFLISLEDNDADWVLEKYLSAFTRAYDPHSDYMSPRNVEDFEIEMQLSLVGIGALLRAEDGAAKVIRIIPGGPASMDKRENRLRAGDKIIGVGQGDEPPVDVLHWPLQKIVQLIRGKKGTKVMLVVIAAADPTETTIRKVDLIRDEVRLEEQAARMKMSEVRGNDSKPRNMAVITLPAFYADMKVTSRRETESRSCAADMEKLIIEAKNKGAQGILLDLRSNTGGSLPEAIRIAGFFVGEGPVVQVKERFGVRVLNSNEPTALFPGPLVVMVNRISASASEIVAGALQDYGRAIIVGDSKTHGKGTVQTVARLGFDPRLGKIKITAWVYYRVNGDSTQLKGVVPDIKAPSPLEFLDMGEDNLPNAVAWDSVPRARYRTFMDTARLLPSLREQSETRRAEDPRFIAYTKLVNRIGQAARAEEFSLNIDARKEQAKAERELADIEDKLAAEDVEPEGKTDKPDAVLEEGLKILADLATSLEKPLEAPTPVPPTPETARENRGMLDAVLNWMKNII